MLPELKRLTALADARDEVADAVEGESESVESPAELAALLRFVAVLREELREPKRAIQLWNDLLAAAPHDAEALEHLARLLVETGETRSAAEVNLRRGRLARAGAERHARFVEAADCFIRRALPSSRWRRWTSRCLVSLRWSRAKRSARCSCGAAGFSSCATRRRQPRRMPSRSMRRTSNSKAPRASSGCCRRTPARSPPPPLEPYARKHTDPRRLLAVLEARGDPTQLIELAASHERAGDPRRAFATLLRAFSSQPSNAARWRADLERLAETRICSPRTKGSSIATRRQPMPPCSAASPSCTTRSATATRPSRRGSSLPRPRRATLICSRPTPRNAAPAVTSPGSRACCAGRSRRAAIPRSAWSVHRRARQAVRRLARRLRRCRPGVPGAAAALAERSGPSNA